MVWDLPNVLVVSGLVAGGILWIVLVVRAEERRDARTRAAAAGLLCPHCGSRALEWDGTRWGREVDDAPAHCSETGPLFRCAACGRVFRYTERGDFDGEDDPGNTLVL